MKALSKIVLCLTTLVLCACENSITNLSGNKEKPQWTVIEQQDPTSSMTADVKVDLAQHYSAAKDVPVTADDLLAAFVGDKCCGLTAPDKNGIFFLYIVDPQGDDKQIRLRYYSAKLKNIFVTDQQFTFQKDAQLGNVDEPITPVFIIEK